MKCNIEWLSAYLDGALTEEKRAKLEEHLKTCDACPAKLEEFARVEQAAKKIPAPQLSEAYWENFAGRVQNKLTIREKQKTSPGWLEALKGLFQPTTGKLAIAGSVVVIILLTFVSLEQWKKQTFRPPVFEDEKPVVEGKTDSIQTQAKDESSFRTAEKKNKVGLVEDKHLDQPALERGTATLSQKPAENAPAAAAPVGRMLVAPEEQKSKEEPSLAAFAERDEAVRGDTVLVTAGKKAKLRKEVATSRVKTATEETEKLPNRSVGDLSKTQAGVVEKDGQIHIRGGRQSVQGDTLGVTARGKTADRKETDTSHQVKVSAEDISKLPIRNIEDLLKVQGVTAHKETNWRRRATSDSSDTITVLPGATTKESSFGKDTVTKPSASAKPIEEFSLIKGGFDAQYGGKGMPAIDSAQLVTDIKKIISEKEKELKGKRSKAETESLYTYLAQYYVQLYRFSLEENDWKKADQRIADFLKTDLSESARRWLVAIQDELKKLKK